MSIYEIKPYPRLSLHFKTVNRETMPLYYVWFSTNYHIYSYILLLISISIVSRKVNRGKVHYIGRVQTHKFIILIQFLNIKKAFQQVPEIIIMDLDQVSIVKPPSTHSLSCTFLPSCIIHNYYYRSNHIRTTYRKFLLKTIILISAIWVGIHW